MENEIKQEQKDSIELTKNAKGDYQWKIKIYALESKEINERDVQRLDKLNKELERKFGKK